MKIACHYAPIQFRPYPDIGEFVNVGILAVPIGSRKIEFKLLKSNQTTRIHGLFPKLSRDIFSASVPCLKAELEALRKSNGGDEIFEQQMHLKAIERTFANLFEKITVPSESIFQYGRRASHLSKSLEDAVEELFDHYVLHQYPQPAEYIEDMMTKSLKQLLKTKQLDQQYKEVKHVGNEFYHVGFKLAYVPDGEQIPSKIIRPINFEEDDSTLIYNKGQEWIGKFKRLKTYECLPKEILMVAKMPKDTASKESKKAVSEIRKELQDQSVLIADDKNEEAVLDFAQIKESANFVLKTDTAISL